MKKIKENNKELSKKISRTFYLALKEYNIKPNKNEIANYFNMFAAGYKLGTDLLKDSMTQIIEKETKELRKNYAKRETD